MEKRKDAMNIYGMHRIAPHAFSTVFSNSTTVTGLKTSILQFFWKSDAGKVTLCRPFPVFFFVFCSEMNTIIS
jgi:hypothetical protein